MQSYIFSNLLIFATVTSTLVAGIAFTFAVVVMPGIRKLGDGDFIRAFQVIDGVIQDKQPVFALVWLGSAVSQWIVAVLGIWELQGAGQWLYYTAVLLYLFGVQWPTFTINVPLNNALQELDVASMERDALAAARDRFEARWNRSNTFRTVIATLVSVLLLIVIQTA